MNNIKCRSCFFYRNEWCEKIVDSPDPEKVRDCAYFREMTNADKIRSMSDEELAEAIISIPMCVGTDDDKDCEKDGCKDCFLNWLQQPAEED